MATNNQTLILSEAELARMNPRVMALAYEKMPGLFKAVHCDPTLDADDPLYEREISRIAETARVPEADMRRAAFHVLEEMRLGVLQEWRDLVMAHVPYGYACVYDARTRLKDKYDSAYKNVLDYLTPYRLCNPIDGSTMRFMVLNSYGPKPGKLRDSTTTIWIDSGTAVLWIQNDPDRRFLLRPSPATVRKCIANGLNFPIPLKD
jgi:hypothetical protein